MRAGTWAAGIFVLAYVGFEGYAVTKGRYRMQPDYIYPHLVAAKVAAERCGPVPDVQEIGFDATLDRVRGRMARRLAGGDPPLDSLAVAEALDALRRTGEAEADSVLGVEGCDGAGARGLLRRHEIYSTK
jgi:hypothetical protein